MQLQPAAEGNNISKRTTSSLVLLQWFTMMVQHLPSHHSLDLNNNFGAPANDAESDEENRSDSELFTLVNAYDWPAVLARVTTHPSEAKLIGGAAGRMPLHMACEHDAPAVVVQSLLKAYPEASVCIGSSNMTPLHITCSSQEASVHVIRVLLELGVQGQCALQDLDGDTPLHTACRCGANLDVLEVLLQAYPQAVHERDLEGLTPLLRMWVRCFVMLGSDAIESVRGPADLVGELGDAWKKTDLLLCAAHYGSVDHRPAHHTFSLHAAAAVDCPRPIVRIAATVYADQLMLQDEQGRTPLMLAAEAPIYKVRDLSDDGYTFEDVIDGDDAAAIVTGAEGSDDAATDAQPSVLEILLQACQGEATSAACVTDHSGRLPLHVALQTGKKWNQGVLSLVEAFPESLGSAIEGPIPKDAIKLRSPDTGLYPFMLASVRENGDLTTSYEILRHSPSVMVNLVKGIHSRRTSLDVDLDMNKGSIN
jgi:ankyrin repeat protein